MSRVVHFEIPADNPERAIEFYQEVFGWRIEKWAGPIEYWLVMTGPEEEPGINGGLSRREHPGMGVENLIDVPELSQALAAVAASGGEVIRPRQTIPGVGDLAYIKDTEGNVFGLMESESAAG